MSLERVFGWILVVAVVVVLTGLAGCVFMRATSSGKIEHCYVEHYNTSMTSDPVYVVIGYRGWENNVNVATAKTSEEAAAKKAALCP